LLRAFVPLITAAALINGWINARLPARIHVNPADFRHSPSHVLDYVSAELRAFDLGRSFHQPREIVGDAFAGDSAV
jgi:hypothetical protein